MKCFCKGCDCKDCNCREFLKPTKGKILVFAVVLVLAFLFVWASFDCFTVYNWRIESANPSYGPGGRMFLCALPPEILSGAVIFFLWPFAVVMIVLQPPAIQTPIITNQLEEIFFFALKIGLLALGLFLNFLWFMLLSHIMVKLARKLRKK